MAILTQDISKYYVCVCVSYEQTQDYLVHIGTHIDSSMWASICFRERVTAVVLLLLLGGLGMMLNIHMCVCVCVLMCGICTDNNILAKPNGMRLLCLRILFYHKILCEYLCVCFDTVMERKKNSCNMELRIHTHISHKIR